MSKTDRLWPLIFLWKIHNYFTNPEIIRDGFIILFEGAAKYFRRNWK